MIGELTEKAHLYENIAKSNGVELSFEVRNTITDILTYEDQMATKVEKSEKQKEVMERMRNATEFKEHIKKKYGTFYFNYYNTMIYNIKPQYLTRFAYLCSYMNYDNLLVFRSANNRQHPIYEEDLQMVLRISRAETYNTKKELLDNDLIVINDDKTISVNEKFCKKGEIMKNKKEEKVRIFDNAVKEIYEKSKPTEHKKLSLLFRILPYINLRHNIICDDTTEEIEERIRPITIKTLSELLGVSNASRLKSDLLSITVGGEPVILISLAQNKSMIRVNPLIYYKGTDVRDLKYIEEDIKKILSGI